MTRGPRPSRGLMLYYPWQSLLLVKDQGNPLILKYTQILTTQSTFALLKFFVFFLIGVF